MTPDISEADFQRAVIDLARLRGWRVHHETDSRKSPPGLPDLIMVRAGYLLMAELKSAKGRIRAEQSDWLSALRLVALENRTISVCIWRPSDWPTIEAVLR